MALILLVGLRRSGTTIFWESFRQDQRILCFDEPFNPDISELPQDNKKGTHREFIELYNNNREQFRSLFMPIYPEQELTPELSRRQCEYLKWLASLKDAVFMDLVRCNFKLSAIKSCIPDAYVIHLFRDPRAWVTSHLMPSGKGTWRRRVANIYRRRSFWYRKGFFNNWQYEEIIDRLCAVKCLQRPEFMDVDPKRLSHYPAVAKLLFFWWMSYRTMEYEGLSLFGQRFSSVQFEDFCRDYSGTMKQIYSAISLEPSDLSDVHIRPASAGYQPNSPRWYQWADRFGISIKNLTKKEHQMEGRKYDNIT